MLAWYLRVNLLEAHWLPGFRHIRGREGDFIDFHCFGITHIGWSHREDVGNWYPWGHSWHVGACSVPCSAPVSAKLGLVGSLDLQWVNRLHKNLRQFILVSIFSKYGPESTFRPSALDFPCIPTYDIPWWHGTGKEETSPVPGVRFICRGFLYIGDFQHWNPAAVLPAGLPVSHMLK